MRRSRIILAATIAALAVILLINNVPGIAQGTQRAIELSFEWQQAAADTQAGSDFAGWKLYRAETSGGPWTLLATINYSGTPAAAYTTTQSMTSPIGEEKTWYFVLTAFDRSGNETTYSNEALARVDFKPPGVPSQFTVTIRVVPQ
jgi:hypothetical protein